MPAPLRRGHRRGQLGLGDFRPGWRLAGAYPDAGAAAWQQGARRRAAGFGEQRGRAGGATDHLRSRTWGFSRGVSGVDRYAGETYGRFSRPMTMQEAAMAQEQTKRGGDGGDDDDLTASTAAGQERREKLTDETDDLLDEIDDVLEENAEDFVRAYVQKGGQ